MAWKNTRDFKAYCVRRGHRYGRIGRELEQRVAGILTNMVTEGLITDFVAHTPNSPEDQAGRDFTVAQGDGESRIERSFGVTIAKKSRDLSAAKHPDVPQLHFPIGMNASTIRRYVLALFAPKAPP